MHIISLKALRTFWEKHPEAQAPMRHWHMVVEGTTFADFNDLRQTFPSADYVTPYTVFNVGVTTIGSLRRCITAGRRSMSGGC